jgi:uncharacterized 2Fe-2S/4Fe-4S cluster protein (DUF4445 family)
MVEKRCRVTFEPEGKTVYVLPGTTIYEATGEAGIIINSPCGGAGVCGNCKVAIIRGEFEQKGSEKFFTKEELEQGRVLACRTKILGDMVVEIPISSRLYEQKILTEGIEFKLKVSPNVRKIFIQVDKPTLEDQRSDLDRIWDALGMGNPGPKVPVDVLRRLPEKLRKRITASPSISAQRPLSDISSISIRESSWRSPQRPILRPLTAMMSSRVFSTR